LRRRTVITLAFASFAAGCGLVSGLDGLHVGDLDGSVDAGSDVVLVQCDGGCGFSLPPGFALVTFSTAITSSCPGGTTVVDGVSDPTVSQDACSCKCTMKTKATCTAANVELFMNDGGLQCPNPFMSVSGAPGCHPFTLSLPSSARVDESASGKTLLDAGECQTSEVADASTLATTPARLCLPSSCATIDSLCTPPTGQRLCAAAQGDVTCPAPFTERHVIGAGASVACSPCDPSCNINPPNCDFTDSLTLYTDTACTTGSQSGSNCTSIGGATTFKSYEYKITASGGCTTTATSATSLAIDGEQTVCCRPGT